MVSADVAITTPDFRAFPLQRDFGDSELPAAADPCDGDVALFSNPMQRKQANGGPERLYSSNSAGRFPHDRRGTQFVREGVVSSSLDTQDRDDPMLMRLQQRQQRENHGQPECEIELADLRSERTAGAKVRSLDEALTAPNPMKRAGRDTGSGQQQFQDDDGANDDFVGDEIDYNEIPLDTMAPGGEPHDSSPTIADNPLWARQRQHHQPASKVGPAAQIRSSAGFGSGPGPSSHGEVEDCDNPMRTGSMPPPSRLVSTVQQSQAPLTTGGGSTHQSSSTFGDNPLSRRSASHTAAASTLAIRRQTAAAPGREGDALDASNPLQRQQQLKSQQQRGVALAASQYRGRSTAETTEHSLPDMVLWVFHAPYSLVVWYARHTELCVLLFLSLLRALWLSPATLSLVAARAGAACAVLLAALVYGLAVRPYFSLEYARWLGWARALLLIDAVGFALVNAAVAAVAGELGGSSSWLGDAIAAGAWVHIVV